MEEQKKVMLIIMDGWGLNSNIEVNAIAQANTPFTDELYNNYPNTTLVTFGEEVGLPEGQMGNSEVGHMNLGAGRIIYQDLLKISKEVDSKAIYSNPILNEAFDYAIEKGVAVHFMGLVSDGGVHSHINHLKALLSFANEKAVPQTFVHAFTDGRDTDPNGGIQYLKDLTTHCENTNSTIATIIGRYYAMDRDKRWERVKIAYDALTEGKGVMYDDILKGVEDAYKNNITDEFIQPIIAAKANQPIATIKNEDVVICFNFRTDRCRQITEALTQNNFPELKMETKQLYYVTMTRYDDSFKNIKVVYEKDNLSNTLGEILAKNNLTQLRIAETEKYPHVTFFFSGGREEKFDGEHRIMIPSPKVATYDLQPEMSAYEVKDAVLQQIKTSAPHFICLNFANTDMVGHTGVFDAAIKAAETVDICMKEIVSEALKKDYCILLTADHGNADTMINKDGSVNTAHTKNLVPLFLIDNNINTPIKKGKLADLAPTILSIMKIDVPETMTGHILV